jgi:hypothetical protein
MILTSTSEIIAFTPTWLTDQPNAPVFRFRAGSVAERGMLEAELAGTHRAGRVWEFELKNAVRDGVLTLLADDPGVDTLLALFDEQEEGVELSADEKQSRQAVIDVLAEHWQPYRDLTAQIARRRELAPIVAARRFLVGFENVDTTFARGPDGLASEATLAAIDPLQLIAAGNFAYSLLYGGGKERFLEQPSGSDDDPKNSPSAKAKAAGSSTRKRGPKTHA